MALALRFFAFLVLTMCIVASVDAAISCGTVASSLAPCATYLSRGGVVPPACCSGVKSLNGMAQTTPDRQQACHCLQSAAKSISGLNPSLASGLPGKCGVSIPYPISMSTNCNNTTGSNGIPGDFLKCKLFPFSLADKTSRWLKSLPPGSLTTWSQCRSAFLDHFYTKPKTASLKSFDREQTIIRWMKMDPSSSFTNGGSILCPFTFLLGSLRSIFIFHKWWLPSVLHNSLSILINPFDFLCHFHFLETISLWIQNQTLVNYHNLL